MRYFLLISALSALMATLNGQGWTDFSTENFRGDRRVTPKQARFFATDGAALRALLLTAPSEQAVPAENSPVRLAVPLPDGQTAAFTIVAYDVLHPADRGRFPGIRTWYGHSTDHPGQTIFLDWTERGFHAAIGGGGQPAVYLDPLYRGDTDHYQVYFRQELPEGKAPFLCGTEPESFSPEAPSRQAFGDCVLRQYDVAISTTPEYSSYHGATQASQSDLVQSAVVTTINRVNQVFTRDLSLRLRLAASNDQLYFFASGGNPFTDNTVSTLLNENTDVINARLGPGSYALGHVFTRGDNNGLARLRSGCSDEWPGAGATSLESPEGDFFDIDYVSHEMGHQLGANHTQNNSCNYSSRAGMEPGSASTIMGYAGICAPNVQMNSDGYFHGRSIEEISIFLEVNGGGECATIIENSITSPLLSGDSTHLVPRGTPLQLRAGATGDGTLMHNWEQYDVEQATMPPSGESTAGPLFRSFSPTTDTFRYAPSLLSVMAGFDPVWEELPRVGREMNFRMTTRNQTAAYGCSGAFDVRLNVDGDNGPFAVLDPATGNQWTAGQTAQVRWEVAGTDAPAFNSPTVDILITFDNGQTFTTLAEAVPNNGYAEVTAPQTISSFARILVRSTDNVFYNVAAESLNIVSSDGPAGLAFSSLSDMNVSDCFTVRDSLVYELMLDATGGASRRVALSVDGLPAAVTASFSPQTIRPGGSFTLTLTGLSALPQGTYNGTLFGTSPEADAFVNLSFTKTAGDPGPGPGIVGPVSLQENTRPALISRANGMDNYEFQVATDAGFSDLIFSTLQSDTVFALPDYLAPNSMFFWRVRSQQSGDQCALSQWTVADFVTGPCFRFSSGGGPVPISNGPPPQVADLPLSLNMNGTITDIDVTDLSIDHTYVGDLRVELIAPSGASAVLIDRECGSNNNLRMTLDDEAAATGFPCPPVVPGQFVRPPAENLSVFNGEAAGGTWRLRTTDLANQDGGQANGFGLVVCMENASLPVLWLGFQATGRKSDILLTWATEREENNRGFYVERATDRAGDNWTELGFVAAGTAYRFVDATARPATDYFYRLRQTDHDGRVTYSEVRAARLEDDDANDLFLFPNPTSGLIFFQRTVAEHPAHFILTDVSGRTLTTGWLRGETGTLSLAPFPAGVYFLRTDDGQSYRILRR